MLVFFLLTFMLFICYFPINICVMLCFLFNLHYLYSTNLVWFMEITENNKKRKPDSRSTCFILCFGMNWLIFVIVFWHLCLDLSCLFFKYTCSLFESHDTKCFGFISTRSLKNEFRGNWGAIFDFPGVPNGNKS